MFLKMSLAALLALAIWSPIASHLQHVKGMKVLGFAWAAMGEIVFPEKTPPPSLGAIAIRDPFLSDERPLSRRETRRDFRD